MEPERKAACGSGGRLSGVTTSTSGRALVAPPSARGWNIGGRASTRGALEQLSEERVAPSAAARLPPPPFAVTAVPSPHGEKTPLGARRTGDTGHIVVIGALRGRQPRQHGVGHLEVGVDV